MTILRVDQDTILDFSARPLQLRSWRRLLSHPQTEQPVIRGASRAGHEQQRAAIAASTTARP
jgi:hypothetical protein